MPETEDISGYLRFPAQASELYLAADWASASGDHRRAARLFFGAAQLWRDAADALESISPSEAIQQRINHVVTLYVSGDIPQGDRAGLELDRFLAVAPLSEETRRAFEREWSGIKHERISPIREKWDTDWRRLREEVGQINVEAASAATALYWMRNYPCYRGAHYLGFVAADREKRLEDARHHLEDMLFLAPDNVELAGIVLTRLWRSGELPGRMYSTATAIFDRLRNRSARICYFYALLLIYLSETGLIWPPATQLLESAAAAARQAYEASPSDASDEEWAWAQILEQYCHWRLGRPGAECPQGRFYFSRGMLPMEVSVPDLQSSTHSATALVEAIVGPLAA